MWILYLAAALIAFTSIINIYAYTAMSEEMRQIFFEAAAAAGKTEDRSGRIWIWDTLIVLALAAMAIVVNSLWMWIVGGAIIAHYLITDFGPRGPDEYKFTLGTAVHVTIRGAVMFGYSLFFILATSMPR